MISLLCKLNLLADYWEQYKAEVAGSLQRRWKRLSEGLLKDVQPDKIWVSIRTANRVRDRPDQTPSSAERGGRTPGQDWLPFLISESSPHLLKLIPQSFFTNFRAWRWWRVARVQTDSGEFSSGMHRKSDGSGRQTWLRKNSGNVFHRATVD